MFFFFFFFLFCFVCFFVLFVCLNSFFLRISEFDFLDAAKYSGHSLRRGGASFALLLGLPIDLIKIQDWRSNACERHLEPAFELQ